MENEREKDLEAGYGGGESNVVEKRHSESENSSRETIVVKEKDIEAGTTKEEAVALKEKEKMNNDGAELALLSNKPQETKPYQSSWAENNSATSETDAAPYGESALGLHKTNSNGNEISLSEVEPVDICVRNLGARVDVYPRNLTLDGIQNIIKPPPPGTEKWKTLLDNVSADFPRGTLTAIIGGSGSGKTTMLNIMSRRMMSGRLETHGTASFNGKGLETVRSAYVMQQDILLPTLTVRETLQYSADLRLPPPTTAEERARIVEEVISELGLKECADTRIGTHTHKGCSGGEKRRVSVGVQLLSNPSVLWLDEPTTGLDATSAFHLVKTLKSLARKGRTIVTTIHQPRSEIYGIFDNIVVLSRGEPVYSGPESQVLEYFEARGHRLPPFVNPAEWLIDMAAIDNRSPELEQESLEKVNKLKEEWYQESVRKWGDEHRNGGELMDGQKLQQSGKDKRSTFRRQIQVLTARTHKVTSRDPMGFSACIIEAVLMGVITGWIFYKLDGSQSGIRSRQGALYTAAGLQGYLVMMYETFRLSIDIQLFDRERGEGVVDVIPFLLSRRFARFFLEDLPVPFIFGTIFYFMAGFNADAAQYFTFFVVIFLGQYISISFATLCIAFARSFAGASLIGNLSYTFQSLACGYFIQSNTIPVYVRWMKWITNVYYSFGALAANEFVDNFYDCPVPDRNDPICIPYTGAFIMDQLGFPNNWIWRPILVLIAMCILFYSAAGVVLYLLPVTMTIGKARNSDADLSAGKEKMAIRTRQEVRAIDIGLEDFAVDLDKRNILGKKQRKTILNPVNAQFEAGKLNVIMGPSGSGKTSLLNAMALRLFNRIGTTYIRNGNMTFNGQIPSNSVIRSVCSYVCQDDDALLPSLTVRETLRFAAGLRLPSHMSKEEKTQRAEAILLKMGLKDCADNLIGNELVKGISGGEKRRVTIAVQILTDPRVLLLDEPTSGLDAFTASSIMEVLRGLADEGRTLILTIHQSRSDLFPHFGNVLLLARGGSPCYAGPGNQMLSHFASLGHPCPTTTNPADFALDLITVDLREGHKEEASRKRVTSLIQSWTDKVPEKHSDTRAISTPAELGALVRGPSSFGNAYPLLCHRAWINIRRQPELMGARIMQVLGLGLILALFFSPLKTDYYSIQNRVGYIQEFCALYFVGMLQNVAIYPNEKSVFYREHDDGAYSVEVFMAQYTSVELPFEICSNLLFAVLMVFAGRLPYTAPVFFVVFFTCFCIVSCGESLGIMFNTLFSHSGFALNLTSVLLSIALAMSGILSIAMPGFLQGVNYLSPIRYAIRALAPYTLRGVQLTCNDLQRLPNGQCLVPDGEAVLELFQLGGGNPGLELLGVGIATLVYRLLAWAMVRAVRTHWSEIGQRMKRK